MARHSFDIPTTLGDWLALFRCQRAGEPEFATAERFGPLLGVSGSTVRRWERNELLPDQADIECFARVCRLSALQEAFLQRCATRRQVQPPDAASFQEAAHSLLQGDLPALLLDGLFYARAWNNRVEALGAGIMPALSCETHAIADVCWQPESDPEAVRDAVCLFWFLTATACGEPEYARLLTELAGSPAFSERWLQLARDALPAGLYPAKAGRLLFNPSLDFELRFSSVFLPAGYYLLQYAPLTPATRQRLRQAVRRRACSVSFSPAAHWPPACPSGLKED